MKSPVSDKATCCSNSCLCDELLKNHPSVIFICYKVWEKIFILDGADDYCPCVGDELSRHDKYIDVKPSVMSASLLLI